MRSYVRLFGLSRIFLVCIALVADFSFRFFSSSGLYALRHQSVVDSYQHNADRMALKFPSSNVDFSFIQMNVWYDRYKNKLKQYQWQQLCVDRRGNKAVFVLYSLWFFFIFVVQVAYFSCPVEGTMKTTNLIQLSVAVLCLVSAIRCDEIESRSLVDTFNEIYDTCLVHLSIDCAQPKALEWLSRSIHKREIRITDNLSIVKNDSAVVDSDASQENGSGRDNRFDLISQVDDFLSTHYLNIRYPKSVINAHVPAFMASTVDKLIPHGVQVPLEEGNVNEGK